MAAQRSFENTFEIPRLNTAAKIVFTIHPRSDLHDESADAVLELPTNMKSLELTLLGMNQNTGVPDFEATTPVVAWSGTPGIVDAFGRIAGWSLDPTTLNRAGSAAGISNSVVQIHYPPDQLNGLSFHIFVTCSTLVSN